MSNNSGLLQNNLQIIAGKIVRLPIFVAFVAG